MEVVQLWAGVVFTALSGDTEGLLNDAAQAGIHLSRICPQPGGFSGRCAAWRYQKLPHWPGGTECVCRYGGGKAYFSI